jgi:glycosyltransferase involved in cell wall biosynthesis
VYTVTRTVAALNQINNVQLTLVSVDDSLQSIDAEERFLKRHGVIQRFPIVSLNSLSNIFRDSPGKIFFQLSLVFANISLIRYLWTKRREYELVYFRDHLLFVAVLFAKYFLRKKVIYENHYILTKRFGQWVAEQSAKLSDGIVAIGVGLKDYYQNFNPRVVVAFCAAAEPERFLSVAQAQNDLRCELGLPLDAKILVYSGNLVKTGNGDSYGVEDIIKVLPLLPPNIIFVAVGKKGNDITEIEKLAMDLGVEGRLKVFPWVDRYQVPRFLLAGDILLIPSSGAQPGNSPTKMFEYLVSGRPIIAADTPPIAEVLHHNQNALLVDYLDTSSWKEAIIAITEDSTLAVRLVDQARLDGQLYTWETRAQTIADFINSVMKV